MQAIRQEPHLRFHLTAAAFVLYFQRYFALERSELALLILTIALVISAELVNTAIERTVDLCCPQRNPLAKLAKDAAAGAVLVALSSFLPTAVQPERIKIVDNKRKAGYT